MITFLTHSEKETVALGKRIGKYLTCGSVVALEGNLGSGKTTITKGFVAAITKRKHSEVKSPTFTLVNQYAGTPNVYHIDCYRIDEESEFENIGIDDFLFGDGIAIVEWAEKIRKYLPQEHLALKIDIIDQSQRRYQIKSKDKGLMSLLEKELYGS